MESAHTVFLDRTLDLMDGHSGCDESGDGSLASVHEVLFE